MTCMYYYIQLTESAKKHHENFKEGPFGTAINNKCGKLRTEQKDKVSLMY